MIRRLSSWYGALLLLVGGSAPLLCGPSNAQPVGQAPPHRGIDVQHYVFRLALSDTTDVVKGEATVRLRVATDTLSAVRLDLVGPPARPGGAGMRVTSVTEEGDPVDFSQAQNHLRIQPRTAPAVGQERTYTITYAGAPADGLIIGTNQHGARTFFGDNWPNRARYWLPVVDHPSDKATVEFEVTAPEQYEVVSNGARVSVTTAPGGLRTTHWRATAPLPTKVMVIGVADFAIDSVATHEGVPIQSWVYPQDRTTSFRELSPAPRILAFFEERLGPYPYEKLANVESTTRYGGMENASAIFYSERAIGDGNDDEPLLAHEIAHQWYGNTVTESDWPHLWLSEGFATYLTQLYLEATYGRERLVQGMQQARTQVIQFHRQQPDAPLVDTTYSDANELLNTNPYQKGAWVLHMLRHRVGDETFWEGLRTYYTRFRGENASTSDFQAVMEEASGQNLDSFFEQWTRRAGHPEVAATWRYDTRAGECVFTLRQTQDGPPFEVPVDVEITSYQSRVATFDLREREQTFRTECARPPGHVAFDPNTWLLMRGSIRQAD